MIPDEASKRSRQTAFVAGNVLIHLGNGPTATGGQGWAMNQGLYFRCVECGYLMLDDPDSYDECFCGLMFKDVAACRIGSDLGDDAIEVYRATPGPPATP